MVETNDRMISLKEALYPDQYYVETRKARRTLRSRLTGHTILTPFSAETLRIFLLDPTIEVRDHLFETYSTPSNYRVGQYRIRKLFISLIFFVCLGIITGFLVLKPSVVISSFYVHQVPTVDIKYRSSQDWNLTVSIIAAVEWTNLSLLQVQIPLYPEDVIQQCDLNGDSMTPATSATDAAISSGRNRDLQDQRIPISQRYFDWGTVNSANVEEVPVQASDVNVRRTELPSNNYDLSVNYQDYKFNISKALAIDGFVATFGLETPDHLNREFFRLCMGEPLTTKPLIINKDSTKSLTLKCDSTLNSAHDTSLTATHIGCKNYNPAPALHTSFMQRMGRSPVYRRDVIRPVSGAEEVRVQIDDVVAACRSYGHIWLVLTVESVWQWSFGGGGSRVAQQTTSPIAIPCSVS